MQKTLLSLLLLFTLGKAHAQFSLGATAAGLNFSRAKQNEIALSADSSLSTQRFAFSYQAQITAGYDWKGWEFTLGAGYQRSKWDQRFKAYNPALREFLNLNPSSDSMPYLSRVKFSTQYLSMPMGVKYLIKHTEKSRVNLFLSFQLVPSFAFKRSAAPEYIFVLQNSGSASLDPNLAAATQTHFEEKSSFLLIESKQELGLRFWGKGQAFCIDGSLGLLQSVTAFHEYMQPSKGITLHLGFRYFFPGINDETIKTITPDFAP